ncbi:hypothetical protein B0T25DRAFT_286156 [Lasiosphaeria hispida]|uniref:Uncharacterized protein n=1 Tax=Lasiosphaeria hispida TaxID=260671 RepID=A0AAJ0HBT0_9PEZI|nr:hypothetical protein B0T25DRAFT_286156 [Lasiosphaeria hispida]
MASEIHKKRTGKGFKISEEIVLKEEMYEEDEDEIPRPYRALAAHLQTASPELNHRMNAYLTNQVALASLAHEAEVNRMFAEQFPNAAQLSQRLSQSVYMQPLQDYSAPPAYPHNRTHSVPYASPASSHQLLAAHHSPFTRHASIDGPVSPPALTPGSSGGAGTPQSRPMATPPQYYCDTDQANKRRRSSGVPLPVDPSLGYGSMPAIQSSFTSELPSEAKQMAHIDMNDPMAPYLFASGLGETIGSDMSPEISLMSDKMSKNMQSFSSWDLMPSVSKDTPMPPLSKLSESAVKTERVEFLGTLPMPPAQNSEAFVLGGTIGTPGGGSGGDDWDKWIYPDGAPESTEAESLTSGSNPANTDKFDTC